ncbi:MAG: hypothetical protein ACKO1M_03650, partial [Planctomycetota bacterium]
MIFSTLALVVGFLALTTSGFMPTVSFGWLSCLTLLGGLVGNLVVLPVLLTLLAPRLARPSRELGVARAPRAGVDGKRRQDADARPASSERRPGWPQRTSGDGHGQPRADH